VVVPIIWDAHCHLCFSDTLFKATVNLLIGAIGALTSAQSPTIAHLPPLNAVLVLTKEARPAWSVQALPKRTVGAVPLKLPNNKDWEQDESQHL